MSKQRKTPRLAAAVATAACAVMAFAALGGVGLAQTSGGPGKSQYGKTKITICHKGKTIKVAQAAWKGHKRHGDALGTCAAAQAKKAKAAKAKAAKVKAAKAKAAKAKAAKAKAEKGKADKAEAKEQAAEQQGQSGHPGKGKGRGKG